MKDSILFPPAFLCWELAAVMKKIREMRSKVKLRAKTSISQWPKPPSSKPELSDDANLTPLTTLPIGKQKPARSEQRHSPEQSLAEPGSSEELHLLVANGRDAPYITVDKFDKLMIELKESTAQVEAE